MQVAAIIGALHRVLGHKYMSDDAQDKLVSGQSSRPHAVQDGTNRPWGGPSTRGGGGTIRGGATGTEGEKGSGAGAAPMKSQQASLLPSATLACK